MFTDPEPIIASLAIVGNPVEMLEFDDSCLSGLSDLRLGGMSVRRPGNNGPNTRLGLLGCLGVSGQFLAVVLASVY